MKKKLLKLMKCPYCGTDFEIEGIYSGNEENIINGCIKCECDTHPITGGILILKNIPMKKYIVNFLRNKEFKKAITFSLGCYITDNYCVVDLFRMANYIESKPLGKPFKKILLYFVNRSSEKRYLLYSNNELSFCNVLGNDPYEIYQKHRFSSQTFWSIYPFIKLLREKQERILDVCCGAGHASFAISKYVNPSELIGVDGEFKSLYLTKKYFSNAELINIDANYQLPFRDNTFSSIFMMDAFHYIDARALLAKEFKRILNKDGMLLLLHLHNALAKDPPPGKPLSPSTWMSLFDYNIMALPEESIINDFILRDQLDLSKKYSEEKLNLSDTILIRAKSDSNCFEEIWKDILDIKGNLIINPIYKIKEEGNRILLERNFPSESLRRDCPLSEKYLPEWCVIDKRLVKGRSVCASDLGQIEDLMRKFVVINVPERYI